jgi:hypothetical protein
LFIEKAKALTKQHAISKPDPPPTTQPDQVNETKTESTTGLKRPNSESDTAPPCKTAKTTPEPTGKRSLLRLKKRTP